MSGEQARGSAASSAARVSPGVRQPLTIGIFVRTDNPDTAAPAEIKYPAVRGRRHEKFVALNAVQRHTKTDQLSARPGQFHVPSTNAMTLTDEQWQSARTDCQAPFTTAAAGSWTSSAMDDLFVWTTPGIAANRTWIIAPEERILGER